MKKKMIIGLTACFLGLFSTGLYAQDTTTAGQDIKHAAQKTGKAAEKTANQVGNKSAQIAANTKAAVVDQVYKGKVSPGGHRVYINNDSKYYWIDTKGHKHFVSKASLKDKSE